MTVATSIKAFHYNIVNNNKKTRKKKKKHDVRTLPSTIFAHLQCKQCRRCPLSDGIGTSNIIIDPPASPSKFYLNHLCLTF